MEFDALAYVRMPLFTFLSGSLLGLGAEKIIVSWKLKLLLGILGLILFLSLSFFESYRPSLELIGFAMSPWLIVVF